MRFTGSKPNRNDRRTTISESAIGWTCQACLGPIGPDDRVVMHNPPGSTVTAVRHHQCPTQPEPKEQE